VPALARNGTPTTHTQITDIGTLIMDAGTTDAGTTDAGTTDSSTTDTSTKRSHHTPQTLDEVAASQSYNASLGRIKALANPRSPLRRGLFLIGPLACY